MSVDPIITMGYGPNSNAGSIMRWGYIGFGEIIRRAIQQVGKSRREIQVIVRDYKEEYGLKGNVMVPFDLSIRLKVNLLRRFSRFYEVLANISVDFDLVLYIKGNVSRVFGTATDIYSDIVVPFKKKLQLKGNVLANFIEEYRLYGEKDMTKFIEEFILDDDEEGSS